MNKSRVTMKDVAEKAGVSITTVSHVINKTRKVDEKTKKKIIYTIRDLGYMPNIIAQSLKGKASKTIGVIISDIREAFFSEVIKAIEAKANEKGYSVLLHDSENSPEKERTFINELLAKGADGVIFAPADMDAAYPFANTKYPIVLIDRKLTRHNFDYIGTNHADSAALLTSHILELGCKHIAFIGRHGRVYSIQRRIYGFESILKKANLFDPNLILRIPYEDSQPQKCLLKFFKNHPEIDGVICTASTLCLETLEALEKMNKKIPQEIKIASYDDKKWFDFLKYPISTVKQPTATIGQAAVEALLEKIANPNSRTQLILDAQFIKRT